MLDCAIIDDQNAATEFAAMLQSFQQQVGEWVVELPVGRIVSGMSDNASGAVKGVVKVPPPPPPPPPTKK